jgi:hypothetical protein
MVGQAAFEAAFFCGRNDCKRSSRATRPFLGLINRSAWLNFVHPPCSGHGGRTLKIGVWMRRATLTPLCPA